MSVPATTEQANESPALDATSTGRSGAEPAQEHRADPTQVSSEATPEQPTRGPDYFRQAFARIRPYAQAAAPDPVAQPASNPVPRAPTAQGRQSQEPERSAGSPSSPHAGTTLPQRSQQVPPAPAPAQAAPPDGRLVLTQDELHRRAQAEADRIIAKREADRQAAQEREAEVELRRTNPFEYARMMEDREQQLAKVHEENKTLTTVVSRQLFEYDRNVLDIFVSAVPDSVRDKVIAKTEGIPGRKETAAATLRALRQTYLAEGKASARAELMKDPLFVKEILARFGGTAPVPESAPVQARPSRTSEPDTDNAAVNDWMRSAANSARYQR